MSYFDGFILPVPAPAKKAFIGHAEAADKLIMEHGALRILECWGENVPEGNQTDFRRAVQANDDEEIVFSFIEWPDKAARDAGMKAFMEDPRLNDVADMPFDGKRMILGGFEEVLQAGSAGDGYLDGWVAPVPDANREAFTEVAIKSAEVFRDHGAARVVQTWGEDVSRGRITDFYRAVKAEDGESVVFHFVEWPDKQTRDAGWKRVEADPRLQPGAMELPFDGKRMIQGGFIPVVMLQS
jgi:uncharacterized protein YbaA (DUF1428 family)